MGKAAKSPRRIVIGGRLYRWKVEHRHRVVATAEGAARCREVFTAFLDGERAPLRVLFTEDSERGAGYPEAGVVWTAQHRVNLNEPGNARRLIEIGLAAGWTPTDRGKEFVIEDGFAYMDALAKSG